MFLQEDFYYASCMPSHIYRINGTKDLWDILYNTPQNRIGQIDLSEADDQMLKSLLGNIVSYELRAGFVRLSDGGRFLPLVDRLDRQFGEPKWLRLDFALKDNREGVYGDKIAARLYVKKNVDGESGELPLCFVTLSIVDQEKIKPPSYYTTYI